MASNVGVQSGGFCQRIRHLIQVTRGKTPAQQLRAQQRRHRRIVSDAKFVLEQWVLKYGTRRGLSNTTITEIQRLLVGYYGSLGAILSIEITLGGFDVPLEHRSDAELELICVLGGTSVKRTQSSRADCVLEWIQITVEKMELKKERRRMGWWKRAKDNGGKVLGRYGLIKREWDRRDLRWEG